MENKKTLKGCLDKIGVSYLSAVSSSSKTYHSELMGFDQTGLYLAPWNVSGYQVCPGGANCHKQCLAGSGHGRVDQLSKKYTIQRARVRKTQAFFRNKPDFMFVLCKEIKRHKARASRRNHNYFVRLNCTSDISPKAFNLEGRNILEIFPDVQFVDYTKVPSRIDLTEEFPNYDLTFSYDGHNWGDCEKALKRGVRVAVVGDCPMPKTFNGYPVVNGDLSDIRHLDPKSCVVWLKYKPVANDFVDHKYNRPDTDFVIKEGDKRAAY